eukprot:sb/3469270/
MAAAIWLFTMLKTGVAMGGVNLVGYNASELMPLVNEIDEAMRAAPTSHPELFAKFSRTSFLRVTELTSRKLVSNFLLTRMPRQKNKKLSPPTDSSQPRPPNLMHIAYLAPYGADSRHLRSRDHTPPPFPLLNPVSPHSSYPIGVIPHPLPSLSLFPLISPLHPPLHLPTPVPLSPLPFPISLSLSLSLSLPLSLTHTHSGRGLMINIKENPADSSCCILEPKTLKMGHFYPSLP